MHKSKLAGFSIDCKTDDLDAAAQFWAQALGAEVNNAENFEASAYVALEMRANEPLMEVQSVSHDSRIHLDIETDDIPAEVKRLEALGATKVAKVRDWIVMESPTGQRFCVVPVTSDGFDENARPWGGI